MYDYDDIDSYDNDELKGKDVIFVVTVNYIEEEVIPEYNDEFVKKITGETEQPLNTTKEFEDSIIEYLQAEKQDNYDYDIYAQMMTYILDNSEIKSLPESEVNTTFERVKDNAEYEFNMYGQMYGFDTFESYITNLYAIQIKIILFTFKSSNRLYIEGEIKYINSSK